MILFIFIGYDTYNNCCILSAQGPQIKLPQATRMSTMPNTSPVLNKSQEDCAAAVANGSSGVHLGVIVIAVDAVDGSCVVLMVVVLL